MCEQIVFLVVFFMLYRSFCMGLKWAPSRLFCEVVCKIHSIAKVYLDIIIIFFFHILWLESMAIWFFSESLSFFVFHILLFFYISDVTVFRMSFFFFFFQIQSLLSRIKISPISYSHSHWFRSCTLCSRVFCFGVSRFVLSLWLNYSIFYVANSSLSDEFFFHGCFFNNRFSILNFFLLMFLFTCDLLLFYFFS